MTLRILRIGNSLAFLLFLVSMLFSVVGDLSLAASLMKLGFFALLLTPIFRLLVVGGESIQNKEHQARKWMVLVVILLLAVSALLGSQH